MFTNPGIDVHDRPEWVFTKVRNTHSTATAATVAGSIAVGAGPGPIAMTLDGDRLFVSNRDSDNLTVVATGTDTVVATIPVGDAPAGIAIRPDGSELWVANRSAGTVSIVNVGSLTVTATLTVGYLPVNITFSHDGVRAYIVHGGTDVWVLDAATHALLGTIPAADVGQWLRISADDSTGYLTLVGISSTDFYTQIVDLDTLQIIGQIPGAGVYVFSAFSPTAWGISAPDTVAFVNLPRAQVRKTFSASLRPNDMALSPDGERLLTTHDFSHLLTIRHAVQGALIQSLAMPGEPTGVVVAQAGTKAYVSQLNLGTIAIVSLP